jgi:hypothetical protein
VVRQLSALPYHSIALFPFGYLRRVPLVLTWITPLPVGADTKVSVTVCRQTLNLGDASVMGCIAKKGVARLLRRQYSAIFGLLFAEVKRGNHGIHRC